MARKTWRLDEWNDFFVHQKLPNDKIIMTDKEIAEATKFLREYNYPKPEDCPNDACPCYRPACELNICQIACKMAGDF